MVDVNNIVNKIMGIAGELGIAASVEEYGRERVVILEIGEDFSIYVSIVCNSECDIEYAIGDENFTFKSSSIELLRRAVEIIERINNETTRA
ncbi:MAG: hypothetical protein ACP5GZ_01895 [Vulcanisaeta sp.]|uniref:hypothetical protein n=1 Tax=Vulcanisaeta sp. TaxID=2020871 RepID=UPI003D15122B